VNDLDHKHKCVTIIDEDGTHEEELKESIHQKDNIAIDTPHKSARFLPKPTVVDIDFMEESSNTRSYKIEQTNFEEKKLGEKSKAELIEEEKIHVSLSTPSTAMTRSKGTPIKDSENEGSEDEMNKPECTI